MIDQNYSTTKNLIQLTPLEKTKSNEGGLRLKGYFKESRPERPLLSIITVVFNGEAFLEGTIKSVINQSYDNIEYIIIDGGSSDKTLDIIKRYENAIDYWVSEPDNGIYDAMNKGITLSSGDSIGIISSDDWYEIDAISTLVKSTQNISDLIVFGSMNVYKKNIKTISNLEPSSKLSKLTRGMAIFHPSTFIGRKIYEEIGLYDPNYKISADYKLILKAYLENIPFKKIHATLSNFRHGGVSSNFTYLNLTENIRLRRELAIWPVAYKELILFLYFRFKGLIFR